MTNNIADTVGRKSASQSAVFQAKLRSLNKDLTLFSLRLPGCRVARKKTFYTCGSFFLSGLVSILKGSDELERR